MDTTRQDFMVGLLIVSAIAVVVGALLATSGFGERRYDLYMRSANAEGLTIDSRVVFEGLEVGRVVSVSPRVDSVSHHVTFIAHLKVIERFSGGANLRLPVGTRAQLEQASQLSPSVLIRLELPDTVQRGGLNATLASGDTINAFRKPPLLAAVADVATHMSTEVSNLLQTAQQTLRTLNGTLNETNTTIVELRPDLRRTLASVAATMDRVNAVASRINPAIGDSVSRAIALSTSSMSRLDSLLATANELTGANRKTIQAMMDNLEHLTEQINHLAAEMSRRPYRFITGVTPLTFDSASHAPVPPKAKADTAKAATVVKDSTRP